MNKFYITRGKRSIRNLVNLIKPNEEVVVYWDGKDKKVGYLIEQLQKKLDLVRIRIIYG